MPQGITDFAGQWRLVKHITDRRGPEARFEGLAEVAAQGAGQGLGQGRDWTYTETGTLTFDGGGQLQAERRYLWAPAAEGIATAFDDGRPFHVIPLAGGEAHHDCPPDSYRVRYDFSGWPLAWSAHWHVTGPRKDYDMACHYHR